MKPSFITSSVLINNEILTINYHLDFHIDQQQDIVIFFPNKSSQIIL